MLLKVIIFCVFGFTSTICCSFQIIHKNELCITTASYYGGYASCCKCSYMSCASPRDIVKAKPISCRYSYRSYLLDYWVTTSFDLGGVISGNRMAGVPLGRSLGDGELDVEGICLEPGVACQNCTHAVTCVLLPVGWLKVPLQQCPEGQTCNAHKGKCSERPVPECDVVGQKYEHTCEQVGIFPDAHDCRKFHLCSPAEGLPDGRPADHRTALCPRHYGYNPQNAQCSIKLHKGQCTQRQVPECTTVGQTGALLLSPNHYYVCLVKNSSLYPQIFICPHGWYFVDGYCRESKLGSILPPNLIPTDNKETGNNGKVVPSSKDTIGSNNYDDTSKKEEAPITPPDVIPADSKEKGDDDKSVGHPEITIFEKDTNNEEKKDLSSEEEKSPTKHKITRMDWFFSTEKTSTYAADTFLADKFDLANYEAIDDVAPPVEDFSNSFESGVDFW